MDEMQIGGFEWDEEKDLSNYAKHRITFDEAAEAILNAEEIGEGYRVRNELRHEIIAPSSKGRMLLVIIPFRGFNVRIISARRYRK